MTAMNPDTEHKEDTESFEQALQKLETIVEQLERGDVPLEQAIDLFQEGMRLSRLCNRKLEHVERKIDMLAEGAGGFEKKPFAAEEKGE